MSDHAHSRTTVCVGHFCCLCSLARVHQVKMAHREELGIEECQYVSYGQPYLLVRHYTASPQQTSCLHSLFLFLLPSSLLPSSLLRAPLEHQGPLVHVARMERRYTGAHSIDVFPS